MDRRNVTMILVFLLCVIEAVDMQSVGHALDVCGTCHANATCDDKSDGSGKVCHCMFGFVGNGRTYCQDKDECQIGANKICGQHTSCHNTYGSYYCTCLTGYSPSNSMAIFIPNDGTHCRDIDECRIPGICGEGGRCRNLEGSFECSCHVGYRLHNGAAPFHPERDKACCKVIDCGQPPSVEDTVLLSATGTRYGNMATFGCVEGFIWKSGHNSSVCGADAVWKGPTMVCEEVDCGSPPALPHSHMLWNKTSRMGSEVVYQCNSGYHSIGGGSVSICTPGGRWEGASVLCQEILCGSPPVIESTEQVWDGSSTPGSTAAYSCKEGFYNKGGNELSLCNENGHWTQPTLSCQEILCGDPPILPHTGQVWNGSFTPGTAVFYYCQIGFYDKEASNISFCTINGYWTKPNISCTEIDCGAPPAIPHAVMSWDNISTMGSQVVYQCNSGYRSVEEGNVSVCAATGEWDVASLLCQEIKCWEPVVKPHTQVLWDGTSHVGSVAYYRCEDGYSTRSERNYSVCGQNGLWEDIELWCEEISCGPPLTLPHTNPLWDRTSRPGSVVQYVCVDGFYQESGNAISTCAVSGEWGKVSMKCKEIKCWEPVIKPHTQVLWDGTSHVGSVAYYRCEDGYSTRSERNYSVCGQNGLWEDIELWCEEISCGPPLTLPHTNPLWDRTSRPGSVVQYVCVDGFYQESGNAISTCAVSGEWGKVSMKCKAKCGAVPFLANSEVVWYNRSVVIHRCVDGYHSWRGSNVSLCGHSGTWQKATLRCIEIKPAINDLIVFNEKCLRWKAEKYEEDTEFYQVIYCGVREYQVSFRDKRKRILSSKADQLELCLNLLPVTNYSISITAVAARFTATVTANTTLQVPQAPVVHYREFETPLPTLRLRRSANTLDPISLYQVFVLPLEGIMVFDCTSPRSPDFFTKRKSLGQYVTAQIHVRHVGTEMNFTVGDGLHYGGFFNAPLENGRNYYIILRAVNQWNGVFKSSCLLWAKVSGTSYVMRIASLSAGGSIGLVAFVILVGYSLTWFFKKT